MKHWIAAAALVCFCAIPSRAQLVGKLDLASAPSLGAWQSVTSPDQALGVAKNIATLQKDGRELAHLGIFGGGFKPMLSDPGVGPRVIIGLTAGVPGSDLDWLLGTNWGNQWIPALKTGMLFGYDISRPKSLRPMPDFIGLGASYKVGSN